MRVPAFLIAVATVAAASCQNPASQAAPAAPTPAQKSAPPSAAASGPAPLTPPFTQSTLQGVYTDDEAKAGDQVYKSVCVSCHTPVTYSSPAFRRRWAGKPLSVLFYLIKETMPQNAPGSLDEYQYGVVVAYILKLNKMPAGKAPIMGDSVKLEKIRFDTVRQDPSGPGKSGRR